MFDIDECPYCNGFNTWNNRQFETVDNNTGYVSKICGDCYGIWEIEYKVVCILCTEPPESE
jgi:hypothetical protein